MWLSAKFGFVGMMEFKILGDICNIVSGGTPPRSKSQYWDNGNIPWIKIRDIKSKYIEDSEESITIEGLNNSSTKLLTKGTVLYTIFATLGEVGILKIDACTNQAIAGLTVKDETKILPEYLYYYLKSKKNIVNKLGRGAAQNNINLSMLKSFEIEIIDIIKQNNIIRTLNYVDNLIKLKSRELELLDELVKARFVELFGDPVYNEKQWKVEQFGSLGELKRGKSKHRPRNDPILLGGKYPLIQTGDISNSHTYIQTYKSTYSEEGLKQSKMWKAGTLCITIAANIAESAILTFDACFPDSIVGFLPNDKVNLIFIHHWLDFLQPILEENAPAVAQKNLNVASLEKVGVILPLLELQNQFADFVKEVDKSRFIIKSMIKEGLL